MISAAIGTLAWRRLAPIVLVVGLVAVGLGVVGLTAPQAGARGANVEPMSPHGGDVITHNTTYVVWWDAGIGFASGASDQSAYEGRVQDFLSNLEGTTYYHILDQYYETGVSGQTNVGPYTHFGGAWTDFSTPPANPMDQGDVSKEAAKAIETNHWPSGSSTVVIVFLPTGYNVCISGFGCSPDKLCGLHTQAIDTDTPDDDPSFKETPVVAVPPPSNNLPAGGGGCGAVYHWAGGEVGDLWVEDGPAISGDASINVMAHELFEAITDPFDSTGWFNGTGTNLGEIGDLCAYTFDPFWALSGHIIPPILKSDQPQDGTITLGGQNYVVQKEWSNAQNGCVMGWDPVDAPPDEPWATATTADGNGYTFGTWTNQAVSLHVHAADAPLGLGLDDIAVSLDENSNNSLPFTPDADGLNVTSDSYPVPAISGKHTIDVRAHSYSGRQTEARVGEVWYDFKAPDVSLSAPSSSSGWYTAPVAVDVSTSDPDSGVGSVNCTPAAKVITAGQEYEVDVSSQGTTTVSCTATDNAGNASAPESKTIEIDSSGPPTVTVTPPAPVHGLNGWYNAADLSPVDVTVDATKPSGGSSITAIACLLDGLSLDLADTSGIGSTSASATAPVEGGDGTKTLSCTATDEAGQTSSPGTADVKLDATLPSLDGTPTTSPNSNGWYDHDVVVHWTCSDGASGILGGSCPANSLITGEGTNLTASTSVSDVAGNVSNQTSPAVKIDRTAPVVTVVTPSVVHGTNGWFNAQDALPVQVGVTADDSAGGASGVSSIDCTLDGSPVAVVSGRVAVSGDGIHHLSCTSTDKAGNTSPAGAAGSTSTVKIDATAPSFSAALAPANPAATGWYNASTGAPTASYTCSDATSGIAVSCPSSYTFPQGANQTASRTVTDLAGNSSTVAVGPLNVDLTFPSCSATPTPAKLPPQNKSLVPVTVALSLSYDAISGPGATVLSSLTTNEGDIGKESSGWVIGTQSTSGKLLATHDANDGKGRVYTLTYGITNRAGNAKSCVTTVTVPNVPALFKH